MLQYNTYWIKYNTPSKTEYYLCSETKLLIKQQMDKLK